MLGFVTQQQYEPLEKMCDTLSKVSGLKCEYGTLYQNKTVNDSKAVWWLEFDSIAAFNKFLWAGCRRYFTISNNPDWMLVADCGDPEYDNTTTIKMTLEYKKVNASVEEMEIDFDDFRQGVEDYLGDEKELAEKLCKETEEEQSN